MTQPAKIPIASAGTATGSFNDLGSPVGLGYLMLQLAVPGGSLTGGGQVASLPAVKVSLDANGVPSVGQTTWISSQFASPVNPAFRVRLYNANDLCVFDLGNCVLSGNPVDLTALVASSNGVSYSGAVLLSPTGGQTITTGDLTLGTGNFNATLGTYQISGVGPTGSGRLVGQVSPSLTTPNIGVATATQIKQPAATLFSITDNNSGTRFSIPSGGIAQATLNNTSIGGGSTYNGTTLNVQKFTANGTFTIPSGVTSVKATLLGGGGGGGGATASNNGGGGGGAGAAIKYLSGLTPGNTLAVTVGTAGSAGGTGAAGGSGGNSTIASGTQTITTVTGGGGAGGQGNGAQSSGGIPGGASSGDINTSGNSGYDGIGITGGAGGGGMFGGGAANSNGGQPGNAAGSFGGGGGGAGTGGARSGGAGFAGIVIFEWVN